MKKSFLVLNLIDKAAIFILPILNFFYIIFTMIFLVPIFLEINSCIFEINTNYYCSLYFHNEQSFFDFLWLSVFSMLSAFLAIWNVSQIKKDKKFIFAILISVLGVASLISFLFFA
jgi:hypothetical protein